jgi:hypothetical protein
MNRILKAALPVVSGTDKTNPPALKAATMMAAKVARCQRQSVATLNEAQIISIPDHPSSKVPGIAMCPRVHGEKRLALGDRVQLQDLAALLPGKITPHHPTRSR